MIVRSLTNDPSTGEASGYVDDVVAGIHWATDHGADVINLSLGSSVDSITGTSLGDALEYAWGKGTVPVVAAGNDYVLPSAYSSQHAIVVAATNRDDAKSVYSQGTNNLVGPAMWGVAAPGGEGGDTKQSCGTGGKPFGVLSTYFVPAKSSQYACLAGTSMAAPHVSGAMAVLLSQGLTPKQAVDRLLATADDLGAKGKDSTFGSGRINLARAVGAAAVTTTTAASGGGTGGGGTATTKPAGSGGGGSATTGGGGATTTLPVVTTATSRVSDVGHDGATTAAQAGDLTGGSRSSSSGTDAKPALLVLIAVAGVLGSGGATAWWLFLGARRAQPYL
jgi:subtilisin family serine protease